MEENEIMTNEVAETENEENTKSRSTLATLGIIGGALIVGNLAYKKVIKPIIQKRKDSKKCDIDTAEVEDVNFNEINDFEE